MTKRWPPIEVGIFFACVLGYQYWLFDGLIDGDLPTGWFHTRFAVAIGIAVAIAAMFRGRNGLLLLIAPLFKIPLTLRWWCLALAWVPILAAATTLTWPSLPGSPGPAPPLRPGVLIPNAMFAIFVIQVSLADECAWIGYAYNQVRKRWVPLAACIFVGAFWGWWYQPMVGYGRAIAGTAIPVPLFIWTMMATAVVCAVLYNATRSAFIVVAAQASGNFFYLVFPVLPQATGSWFPYAVYCGFQLLLVIALDAWFGPSLTPKRLGNERSLWLWPKRWRPTLENT